MRAGTLFTVTATQDLDTAHACPVNITVWVTERVWRKSGV